VPALVPIPSVPVGRSSELFRSRESDAAPPLTLSQVLDSDPCWSASSETGLEIPFGWSRDARPDDTLEKRIVSLKFANDSVHGLLGGKTGSGKSVLLHDVIVAAAHRYSPDELSMYLIDLKQGVEFNVYERLPHTRVLAMGSEEEFTVNVLTALVAEMNRRNDLFNEQGVRNFESYRRLGRQKLPRILLVIDEFQTLFDERGPGDPLPREAVKELERVATKGRSAGVHMLLSTQSYTWEGGTWLSAKTQANATIRVAMQLADTRQAFGLLTRDPEAVEQLEAAGDGLLEDPALHPDRSMRFRALFESSSEEYEDFLKNRVASLADADRAAPPRLTHVFEGRRRPELNQALSMASRKDLVFGQSLDARGSYVGFQLEGYSQAAHVMLCGERQDELGRAVLGLAAQFLQRYGASGGKVLLGNAYAFPPDLQALIDRLAHWAGDRFEVTQGELQVAQMLQNCASEIEGRLAHPEDMAPPLLLVPFGFNNLSCLNSTAYPPPPERELFSRVLKTGPAARVFLLGATTSWAGASGLLQPEEMGTFGALVALTPRDAARVVGAFDAFIDLPAGYAVAAFPVNSSSWVRFRTFSGSGVDQWLRSAPPLTQGGSPHV
jgi:hypothetical protein